MSEQHIFQSRSGIGFVRQKRVFTSDTARSEATIMRDGGAKLAEIADHFSVTPASVSSMLIRQKTPDLATRKYWQPETVAEAMALRDSGWTQQQIGKKYGCTSKAISNLFLRRRDTEEGRAAQKAATLKFNEWRRDRSSTVKPEIEARQTAEKIARHCLDCERPFDAATRFIRLCSPCKQQNK
jgi:transcriptional regulator